MNTSFITPRAASPARISAAGLLSRFSLFRKHSGVSSCKPFALRHPVLLAATLLGILAGPAAAVPVIPVSTVASGADFDTAIGAGAPRKIVLTDDISLTSGTKTVPKGMIVSFDHFVIKKGSASTLAFEGSVDAGRQQIFDGWSAGEIKGHFTGGVVYPEWWGLTAAHHEVAINCAIKSFSGLGNIISLGEGPYDISAPLDLSKSNSLLQGAGAGRTSIVANAAWSDSTPAKCSLWGPGSNHSAMVWMGSDDNGEQSFRTGVHGVELNCMNAAIAHPEVRISGISAKGYVEENSVIENVVISNFTGFGIGFAGNDGSPAIVNGLRIQGFWISGGLAKDAFPLYFTNHPTVCTIDGGTLDMTVLKPNSEAWNAATPQVTALNFTGNPADGDSVTIGGQTYTFRNSPSAANHVQRDVSWAGSAFAANIAPYTAMSARADLVGTPKVILTAVADGYNGNLAVSVTDGNNNLKFTGNLTSTTLLGGTPTAKGTTTLTFNGQPQAGATVTLGALASSYISGYSGNPLSPTVATTQSSGLQRIYTFVSSNPTGDQVLIGANAQTTALNFNAALKGGAHVSLFNLACAINATTTFAGTEYHSGTTANAAASASIPAATQVIGSHGNPALNDTAVIAGRTYTFISGSSSGLNVHLVDHSAEFSNFTSPHPQVTASESGGTVTLTSILHGLNGHYPVQASAGTRLSIASTVTHLSGGEAPAHNQASLSFTFHSMNLPDDGSTLTVGTKTYTFKDSPDPGVFGHIKLVSGNIGATRANLVAAFKGSAFDSLSSLAAAINADSGGYMTAGPVAHDSFTLAGKLAPGTTYAGLRGNEFAVSVTGSALVCGGATAEDAAPLTAITLTARTPGADPGEVFTVSESSSAITWSTTQAGANATGAPDYVRHMPRTGAHLGGAHISMSNVHIESTTIGVHVARISGINSASISNVGVWTLVDEGLNYSLEAQAAFPPSLRRQAATWPQPYTGSEFFYWKYSTAVLISKDDPLEFLSGQNWGDRVVLNCIHSQGLSHYLVRDGVYGIEETTRGHGQYPDASSSTLAFYARGDAYAPAAGQGSPLYATSIYDKTKTPLDYPNNAKIYFTGPIH